MEGKEEKKKKITRTHTPPPNTSMWIWKGKRNVCGKCFGRAVRHLDEFLEFPILREDWRLSALCVQSLNFYF